MASVWRRLICSARCRKAGSTAPGGAPGRRDGVAGQAGAGRAHSRCQQARKASVQGQVRLIFSTRARAWRTRRAGYQPATRQEIAVQAEKKRLRPGQRVNAESRRLASRKE
jgi:hypothetical protein